MTALLDELGKNRLEQLSVDRRCMAHSRAPGLTTISLFLPPSLLRGLFWEVPVWGGGISGWGERGG